MKGFGLNLIKNSAWFLDGEGLSLIQVFHFGSKLELAMMIMYYRCAIEKACGDWGKTYGDGREGMESSD